MRSAESLIRQNIQAEIQKQEKERVKKAMKVQEQLDRLERQRKRTTQIRSHNAPKTKINQRQQLYAIEDKLTEEAKDSTTFAQQAPTLSIDDLDLSFHH